MPQAEPFLTASEIAKTFKVTDSTVYRWGRDGILNPVTVNGTVRFLRSEVEALFAPTGDAA